MREQVLSPSEESIVAGLSSNGTYARGEVRRLTQGRTAPLAQRIARDSRPLETVVVNYNECLPCSVPHRALNRTDTYTGGAIEDRDSAESTTIEAVRRRALHPDCIIHKLPRAVDPGAVIYDRHHRAKRPWPISWRVTRRHLVIRTIAKTGGSRSSRQPAIRSRAYTRYSRPLLGA